MKRLLVVATLLAVAVWSRSAGALDVNSCCACVDGGFLDVVRSQAAPERVAHFCAQAPHGVDEGLVQRCAALGPNTRLFCVANEPGPSCAKQLADEDDIICPELGAPVAGAPALAALIAAMTAVGAWAVRRQRRG